MFWKTETIQKLKWLPKDYIKTKTKMIFELKYHWWDVWLATAD